MRESPPPGRRREEPPTWPQPERVGAAVSRAHGTASLVEQTARLVKSMCWTVDLQAPQWSALRYFGGVGSHARNVVGLARFQGTTPGTASRTIAVLERRGLIAVATCADDRRARVITLTEPGTTLLAQDPLRIVEKAIAALPAETQQGLAEGLRALIDQLGGERQPHERVGGDS